jgi:hypothetical protein
MAIQYYMRGYNTSAPGAVGYVDWVVNDEPDSVAAYIQSPFLSVNITNITVNKVVNSKVDNFLQPDEGFTLSDGPFLHLNSFDWLHASVPVPTIIPEPQTYVGLAVTRGGTTDSTGQLIPGPSTNFFSTLLWDEQVQSWKFIKNTDGDHVTLGDYLSVNTGDVTVDGYVSVGDSPTDSNMPTTGSIRLQNDKWITASKASNADGFLIKIDTSDRVQVGTLAESPIIYMPGNLRVDGYIRDGNTSSTNGFIRNGNNTSIVTFNNTLNNNNITALSSGTVNSFNNNVVIGDSSNAAVVLNTSTGSGSSPNGTTGVHKFQVNAVTLLEVGRGNPDTNVFIRFTNDNPQANNPSITQTSTTIGNGQNLTVKAQTSTAASSTGGGLLLSSGNGTSSDGYVFIQTGGTSQVIVSPTQTTILGNLLVNGTTTSIASTVVEIADRVINLNSSANQFPGSPIAVPSQLTGFAIDRGSADGVNKRSYYGLMWAEADGYWRFGINTDGYTAQNTLTGSLPVIASAFLAQPTATVPVNTSLIPTVGGFRALNNTSALSSRNNVGTFDLPLVGTDATNHLLWGSPTNNAGTIFNISASTDYDFQVNSLTAYKLTLNTSGASTLEAAADTTSLTYKQADKTTNSGTGATTTIQAQNETGTTSNGGNLNLTSGTGTSLDGYLNLQAGGTSVVTVHTNKVAFLKGRRRHITNVTTTYTILVTDDYLSITTLSAPFTITLPASPVTGDEYVIKDSTGNAATNNVTVSGNGNNIDGSATFLFSQPYASATFTFAGGQWSVT